MLQVLNVGVEAGGAERSVRSLRDELVARGHEVLVVSTDNKAEIGVLFADEVTSKRPTGNPLAQIWRPSAYAFLRGVIRNFNPDVVHLHHIGDFGPAAVWATRAVPTVLTVHGPEEYTLHLMRWLLPPTSFRSGQLDDSRYTASGWLRYRWMRHVLRPAYRSGFSYLDAVIAPSRYMAGAISVDVGETRIRQIYNGIDLPARRPLALGRRLLYVGRLESVKGVDVLLRAMPNVLAAVPDARLRVVGDGLRRPHLESLARQLGIAERIDFTGWVPAAEIGNAYADARVLVIPSVWPENLPTVAIESLAGGLPVVASRVGGIPEIVEDGVTGRLVPPGDAALLAGALVSMLRDDVGTERMATAGVADMVRFGIGVFVDSLEELYAQLGDRGTTHR